MSGENGEMRLRVLEERLARLERAVWGATLQPIAAAQSEPMAGRVLPVWPYSE